MYRFAKISFLEQPVGGKTDCGIVSTGSRLLCAANIGEVMRFFLSFALIVSLPAQEWPQWRGPSRDGVATGFTAPQSWPKQLKKQWNVKVGGGFATPVASSKSIYVFTREADQEVIRAVDRQSGKVAWRQSYDVPYTQNKYATSMGKGPHSTPVYYQEKVYTLGITGVLSCFQAATGAVAWRKDFSKRVDNKNLFTGTAMSPIIDQGMLYVHVGDDRGGSVLALDPATGVQKWTWDGDGPSYSSPVVAEIAGVRQWIGMTLKNVVGLDAKTGALLWRQDFKDEWNENISTPVIAGNRVILSGVRAGTMALELNLSAGKWQSRVVWKNADYPLYMSSLVADGAYLYGLTSKRKGQIFCMEAATGKVLWMTAGREGANASFVSAGDFLFVLNETGDLKVLRRNPAKYDVAAEYKVADEGTWSQPLVLGKQIVIKDADELVMYSIG